MDTKYSTRFLTFVSQTITFETGGDRTGAYTADPVDQGGATKWGISQRAHPHINIKALTYNQAIEIYYNDYWNKYYNSISNPLLAFKVFDMGVLCGKTTAIKLLQQTIVKDCKKTIAIDGKMGPITAAAIEVCLASIEPRGGTFLLNRYLDRHASRFKRIVLLRPSQRRFIKGWLNRLYWTPNTKKEEEFNV